MKYHRWCDPPFTQSGIQVECIYLYAFEFEDRMALPRLAADFAISNVNDADIERLRPDEVILDSADDVYTVSI